MRQNRPSRWRSVGASVVALLLIVLAVSAVLLRDEIVDRYEAARYEPPEAIIAIADSLDLTGKGERTFYASQPVLHGSQAFNQTCPRQAEESLILGCYVDRRIHLYDIAAPELGGIVEVTAAHELLHAEWERMHASERERIGALLEQQYAEVADSRLEQRMEYYLQHQPGTRENELHSILGTEVANLGDELEEHYAAIFHNRGAIVQMYEEYRQPLDDLEAQTEMLEEQIRVLQTEVQAATEQYNTEVHALQEEAERLHAQLEQLDRTDYAAVMAYNAAVADFQTLAAQLDIQRQQLQAQIERHGALVEEFNNVALHRQDLYGHMDSHLDPVPSI